MIVSHNVDTLIIGLLISIYIYIMIINIGGMQLSIGSKLKKFCDKACNDQMNARDRSDLIDYRPRVKSMNVRETKCFLSTICAVRP